MNPNQALWERRRLHSHCRNDATERRGVRERPGDHERARSLGPRVRRRNSRGSGRAARRPKRVGVDRNRPPTSSRPATDARGVSVSPTPVFQHRPNATRIWHENPRRPLRPRRSSIFGAMFRPADPFAVAKGAGPGDAARRPYRDGQLDPNDTDAGGTSTAGQRDLIRRHRPRASSAP